MEYPQDKSMAINAQRKTLLTGHNYKAEKTAAAPGDRKFVCALHQSPQSPARPRMKLLVIAT